MKCYACEKHFEYNPTEYGGQSVDLQGNLCKSCWTELIELKNRQNKELTDWINSKKEKVK